MDEGGDVSANVLKMKSHMDHLERLGSKYPLDLATDLILNSLPKSYDGFVLNYNMNGWDKPISELHAMLKTADKNLPRKTPQLLIIRKGHVKKPNSKKKASVAKGKGEGKKVTSTLKPKKKEKVAKDDACFECGVVGHWKRNCPTYLAALKAKRASEGTSGVYIYMLKMGLFTFSSNTWVCATRCGTHICNTLQGFRRSTQLGKHEMVLYVGNGATVAVHAHGNLEMCLPSGLNLYLNNVYYIPTLTRNILSVSLLKQSDFNYQFMNDNLHAFKNGIFYFEARPINGIYEINLDCKSKDNSIYNIRDKRGRSDLNQT